MDYGQEDSAPKKQDSSNNSQRPTPIGDQKSIDTSYRAFDAYGSGFNPFCPRGGCE